MVGVETLARAGWSCLPGDTPGHGHWPGVVVAHDAVRAQAGRTAVFADGAVTDDQLALRARAWPGLRYARLDTPISSTRNTGWSLGSGSLVKHGSTARPQTFR